jgi:hypothetical protein
LGNLVINSTACDPWYPANGYTCQPEAGEQLLRYIASVGDDGDPATDPCSGVPTSTLASPQSCGNYYFAPIGASLNSVFEAIASRIFTRLTH